MANIKNTIETASCRSLPSVLFAFFACVFLLSVSSLSFATPTVSMVDENNNSLNLTYDVDLESYSDLGSYNKNAFVKVCGASAGQYAGMVYYSAGGFKTISFSIGGPLGQLVPISSLDGNGCAVVDVDLASYTAYYPGVPYVVVSEDNEASSDDEFVQLPVDFSSGRLTGDYAYTNRTNGTHIFVNVTIAYTGDGSIISADQDYIVVGLVKGDGLGISYNITSIGDEVALPTGGYAGNITVQINGLPPIALWTAPSQPPIDQQPQLLVSVEGDCLYQPTNITVLYSDTLLPASRAFVTVTIGLNQIVSRQADSNGRVVFVPETEGVYEIRASATGYQGAFTQAGILLCSQLCTRDSDCGTGICLPNGECAECVTNGQCASGLCVNNACEDCIANEDCTSNLCVSGNCESCTSNAQCTSGLCRNGRCGACDSNDQCATGLCENGACVVCTSDSQCDSGLCSNDACVPCTSSTECASGLCVSNECVACTSPSQCGSGLCETGACVTCESNSECQSNSCEAGTCSFCATNEDCGEGTCLAGVCVECLIDEQCESNLCVGGLCTDCTRNSQCMTNVCEQGVCAVCKESGESCASNSNCCSFECEEGTCITTLPCESGFDCITNYCEAGSCTSCLTDDECKPGECLNGACVDCTQSSDCESNLCLGGLCASCARNSDCPTGICVGGACQACRVSGEECLSNENCCSNSCVSGKCAVCITDADCPFGYCDKDTGSCKCRAGDSLCSGVQGVDASEKPNVEARREARESRALGQSGKPVAFALPQLPKPTEIIEVPRACEAKPFCTNDEDCCGGACVAGSCTCRMYGCQATEECCTGYCYGGDCVSAPKAILVAGVSAIQQVKGGCEGLIENCTFAGCFELCNGLWILLVIVSIVPAYIARKEEFKLFPLILAIAPLAVGLFTFPFAGILIALLEIAFIATKK